MEQGILWARVSTKEQAEEGYSLDAQIKMLRDYAFKNDLKIVREFTVSESATGRQERKQFNEMLEYLENHPEIKHFLMEPPALVAQGWRMMSNKRW